MYKLFLFPCPLHLEKCGDRQEINHNFGTVQQDEQVKMYSWVCHTHIDG